MRFTKMMTAEHPSVRLWVLFVISIAVAMPAVEAQEKGPEISKTTAHRSDWPHWLGPNSDYTSPEKGLLREWPVAGPRVLWRAKIGQGWSCPSVAGGEVYVHGSAWSDRWEISDTESVICLDADTGKELWRHTYEIGGHYQQKNIGWWWGGVRSTPTITEKYVYALGSIGRLTCLDRKTHKVVWQEDLNKTYWPGPYPEWKGTNFSPLVAEGVVLVPFASKGRNRCAALDAETGKLKWVYPADTDLKDIKGCSPTGGFLATFGDDRCVIINGDGTTPSYRALRLSDGTPVWEFEWKAPDGRPGNGPAYILDGQIVNLSSPWVYQVLIDVDFKTPPFAAKVARITRLASGNPYHGFIPSGDAYYGFLETTSDTGKPLAIWRHRLTCIDRKTGQVAWKQEGFESGVSLIAADGLLFARSFQSITLVEATPEGYREKGKVEKLHDVTNKRGEDGGWVMPVLAHGKLYVRTPGELICFKVSKE